METDYKSKLAWAGGAPFRIADAAVSLLRVPHLSQTLGKVRKLRPFTLVPVWRACALFLMTARFYTRTLCPPAKSIRSLDPLAQIRPQRERAILIQFLAARPAHGIAHALDLNLRAQL